MEFAEIDQALLTVKPYDKLCYYATIKDQATSGATSAPEEIRTLKNLRRRIIHQIYIKQVIRLSMGEGYNE